MFTTKFAVRNRRLIAKTGFFRRRTLEILLPKIESVSVNQNVLGRLLEFGTVTIACTGETRESFRAIVEPIGVRKKADHIIEGYMQDQQKNPNQQAAPKRAPDRIRRGWTAVISLQGSVIADDPSAIIGDRYPTREEHPRGAAQAQTVIERLRFHHK